MNWEAGFLEGRVLRSQGFRGYVASDKVGHLSVAALHVCFIFPRGLCPSPSTSCGDQASVDRPWVPATQKALFCTWHLWTHSDCIQQEASERLLVTPWDSYALILVYKLTSVSSGTDPSSTSGRLGRPLGLRWHSSWSRLLCDSRMCLPPVPRFLRPGVHVCELDSQCATGRRTLRCPSALQWPKAGATSRLVGKNGVGWTGAFQGFSSIPHPPTGVESALFTIPCDPNKNRDIFKSCFLSVLFRVHLGCGQSPRGPYVGKKRAEGNPGSHLNHRSWNSRAVQSLLHNPELLTSVPHFPQTEPRHIPEPDEKLWLVGYGEMSPSSRLLEGLVLSTSLRGTGHLGV